MYEVYDGYGFSLVGKTDDLDIATTMMEACAKHVGYSDILLNDKRVAYAYGSHMCRDYVLISVRFGIPIGRAGVQAWT